MWWAQPGNLGPWDLDGAARVKIDLSVTLVREKALMTTQPQKEGTESNQGLLAEIPKNAAEAIRIPTTTYRGMELVDVRVWTIPITTGEDGRPTRKGLTLRPETWRELVDAIANALPDDWMRMRSLRVPAPQAAMPGRRRCTPWTGVWHPSRDDMLRSA
jgi:hypothetical protein